MYDQSDDPYFKKPIEDAKPSGFKNVSSITAAAIRKYPLDALSYFIDTHSQLIRTDKRKWTQIIDEYKILSDHRILVKSVNAEYDFYHHKTPKYIMSLTQDFKQNMVMGNQQCELAHMFREKESRTILGFHIATCTVRYYVIFVSDCKSHTAMFVKEALRHLFNTEWMIKLLREQSIHTLMTWADNANHFKTYNLLYFYLSEILYDYDHYDGIRRVRCGYFIQYHGKEVLDGFFGQISRWYEEYCSEKEEGIHTTKQLCAMIEKMHEKAVNINKNREKNTKIQTLLNRNVDERSLEIVTVDFDINDHNIHQLPGINRLNLLLVDKKSHLKCLQYRLEFEDLTAFGMVEAKYNDDDFYDYHGFKIDPFYHAFKGDTDSGNEYDDGDSKNYTLKTVDDIGIIHPDTLKKWAARVEATRSGYHQHLFMYDYVTSDRKDKVAVIGTLNVTPVPRVSKLKEQKKTVAITSKELRRQLAVRKKHHDRT